MKLIVSEGDYNRFSLIGWLIVFVINSGILIFWSFFFRGTFNTYFAWLNIACYFTAFSLGVTAKKSFSDITKKSNSKNTHSKN